MAFILHYTSVLALVHLLLALSPAPASIPSTLDGPFEPVTVPFDVTVQRSAVDLPDTDYRVRRRVTGFQPEQISVSLSSTYDSVWISWITGRGFLPFLSPRSVLDSCVPSSFRL